MYLLRSTQEEQAGKPHHLMAFVVSPPHGIYGISTFPALSTTPGGHFHYQGNFKWLQRIVFPYVPPAPCLRHLRLLPFAVFHAADKTGGIQGVLSKTMRAKMSHEASQHDNKHALFPRHVSICFLFTLAGQGGAILLFV